MNYSRPHCPWIYHTTKVLWRLQGKLVLIKTSSHSLVLCGSGPTSPHKAERLTVSRYIISDQEQILITNLLWWTYLMEEYDLLKLRLFWIERKITTPYKGTLLNDHYRVEGYNKGWGQYYIYVTETTTFHSFWLYLDVALELCWQGLVNISEIMQFRTEQTKSTWFYRWHNLI